MVALTIVAVAQLAVILAMLYVFALERAAATDERASLLHRIQAPEMAAYERIEALPAVVPMPHDSDTDFWASKDDLARALDPELEFELEG